MTFISKSRATSVIVSLNTWHLRLVSPCWLLSHRNNRIQENRMYIILLTCTCQKKKLISHLQWRLLIVSILFFSAFLYFLVGILLDSQISIYLAPSYPFVAPVKRAGATSVLHNTEVNYREMLSLKSLECCICARNIYSTSDDAFFFQF